MTPRIRSFYARALGAADRAALDDAREVEGLDDEIALLRVQIRELIANEEPDARVVQGAMRLLVQALVAQQRLSGREAEGLGDAVAQVIEEFGAMLATGGEVADGGIAEGGAA